MPFGGKAPVTRLQAAHGLCCNLWRATLATKMKVDPEKAAGETFSSGRVAVGREGTSIG